MNIQTQSSSKTESGMVLMYILLAIALLAALSYAVAQNSRGNASGVTKEKAILLATEIIEYGNLLAQSVTQTRLRGHSPSEISFENPKIAGYTNANCTEDECKIFDAYGGGLALLDPPPDANDGTDWLITTNNVVGVGTTDEELVAVLQNIDQTVCEQINQKLVGTTTIDAEDNTATVQKFTGTYNAGTISVSTTGVGSYCFEGGGTFAAGTYNYYHVLLPR